MTEEKQNRPASSRRSGSKGRPLGKNTTDKPGKNKEQAVNTPQTAKSGTKTGAKSSAKNGGAARGGRPPKRNTPSPAAQDQQISSLVSNPLAQIAQGEPQRQAANTATTTSKEFKLKVIPLGGLGEVGKNMTIIQYGEQMIVVDCGVMFPSDELYGIDMVIPDYSYLVENKDKVLAYILSHGHEDHIGAMPYVLRDVEAPVYSSALALGLLKGKLDEHKVKARLNTVKARQTINIGPFKIEFIHVTHSIPDAFALAVHTPVGVILIASDFKFDLSPIDNELTDFGRLSSLGEKGVLLLMSDSTNVEKKGFTPSEKTVGETFHNIFRNAEGRIFVTSFASNVHRVQQAIWAAAQYGRKVAVTGRGMQNMTAIATELGYLDLPKDLYIDIDKVNSLPANKVCIITTGSQGEPLAGLTRMANGEHRQVQIRDGDTVILSASPIPGNERMVGRNIDNLLRLGAIVIHESGDNVHVSGHASREELKMMLTMTKPKFFMPIHGEYRMLVKHARLAQSLGIPEQNTFVLENGQVLEIGRNRGRVISSVPSGRVLIDGLGVGDVGNTVLKERRILSESGILLVHLVFTKKNGGKILLGPEIFSRGFIFEKEYEHIIDEIKEKVAGLCTEQKLADGNTHDLVNQVRSTLARFLVERTGRRPVILPIITEV